MMELSNSNALIRVRSRMVTASFMALSCAACFLFSSLSGAIFQLCFVTSLYTFFRCFQNREAAGMTFYTFLLVGLGSLAEVHAFWLVPLYWLTMAGTIYCMSWRTFSASLLGLLLPYWFGAAWIAYAEAGDFTLLQHHLEPLWQLTFPPDYQSAGLSAVVTYGFVIILMITGSVHFVRSNFRDKIRVRQMFYVLMIFSLFATLMLALQPQHQDMMLRVMIVCVSPFIAHFVSLTSTRITNAAFSVMTAATVMLTAFNLWMLLSDF